MAAALVLDVLQVVALAPADETSVSRSRRESSIAPAHSAPPMSRWIRPGGSLPSSIIRIVA